jgi:hypothetical protein
MVFISEEIRSMNLSNRTLYLCAALASIALSVWIPLHETVINSDAVCYLLSSEKVGIGGVKSAMQLCGQARWPFYSVLIHAFVQITHVTPTFAAYFIDGCFSLISVLMFIAIIAELGASRSVLWFAALTILLAHDFNSIRQYIVRDHGFYAFYLVSIFALLRYFREPGWLLAFTWSAATIAATIFRIEGAVFLFLIPLAAFFCSRYSWRERLRCYFQLNSLLVSVIIAGGSWLYLHHYSLDQFGRLPELMSQAQQATTNIAQHWQHTRDGMVQLLDAGAKSQANLLLFLMMTFHYLILLLSTLSVIYMLIIWYAWVARAALWTRANSVVVISYLLINLLITIVFYGQHYFLSKRYLIALSLVLMLWVPYGLDKLLRKSHRRHYRTAFAVAMVWVTAASLGGIFDFGPSKAYVREAGEWVYKNVPASSSVYANNVQLMYYSHLFGDHIFEKQLQYFNHDMTADNEWRKFQYLVIREDDEYAEKLTSVLKQNGLMPIKVFKNKRGDQVSIYQVRHEEKVL